MMKKQLLSEIKYQTSRSSGPGGQHVNKTESRVELHWNLEESGAIDDEMRQVLRTKLVKKLTKEGTIILYSQQTRSQTRNREIVTERFLNLLERSLRPAKKRLATKPTRNSVERRLKAKRVKGEKKRWRGGDTEEG
jgi:ribosome-associated protein